MGRINIQELNISCQDVLLQKGLDLNNKPKSRFRLLRVEVLYGGEIFKNGHFRKYSRDASKVSVQVKVAKGAQVALVDIEIKLKCLEAESVHTMHDEIFIETKAEIAEEVVEIV